MRKAAAIALVAAFLLAALTAAAPGCAALGEFSVDARATSDEVTVGDKISIEINVTNRGNRTYQPVVLLVYIYPEGTGLTGVEPVSPTPVIGTLAPGRSANVTVTCQPEKPGDHSATVKIYSPTTASADFKDSAEVSRVFKAVPQNDGGGNEIPVAAILGAVVPAIVAVVAVVAVYRRKRKAAPAAEVPAAQPVREAARETVQGKLPKDYYKFRREKFGRLKPVGITRGGDTILGNIRKQEEKESPLEEPVCVTCCPRCGIAMEKTWKSCPDCGARGTIERAAATVERLERMGAPTAALADMLASARASLVARNYDEAETYAHDVVDRARTQLRRIEEANKPPEEPPSYAGDRTATREEESTLSAPASSDTEAVRGYTGPEQAARAVEELSASREYDGVQPARKEPNACWKCGQGLRPEWKKCPYCNSPQEGICPSCGRIVKLRWNNCPQCRADLSAEKPKPACPVCGAELPAEGDCRSCRALALRDSTARLVREVKAKGADVVEAGSLLGRGELALKIKNYEKAAEHFLAADELARAARKAYRTKRLRERLESAETLIKDGCEVGADVAAARPILLEAREALAADRIDEGLALVEKVNNLVEEAMAKAPPPRATTPIQVLTKKPTVVGKVKVRPRCPHCQEQIDEGLDKCPLCLSDLRDRCPKCGAVTKPGWKVCPACEATLG
ncbi:MAG: hypothetical protein FJ149_07160 [Euryarchaeota archaeon]|nr:hypothetical protein [Euryarchaeota archaeon]